MPRKTGRRPFAGWPQADLVLVLGSQNSSNSQRLEEMAQEAGVAAQLIDGARISKSKWFEASRRW